MVQSEDPTFRPKDKPYLLQSIRKHFLETSPHKLDQIVRSVELVRFQSSSLSMEAKANLLKSLITRKMDHARAYRIKEKCLLHAVHIASYFYSRLNESNNATTSTPFSFLKGLHTTPPLPEFLSSFLRLAIKHDLPYHDIAAILASGLLMKCYPAGAHSMSIR